MESEKIIDKYLNNVIDFFYNSKIKYLELARLATSNLNDRESLYKIIRDTEIYDVIKWYKEFINIIQLTKDIKQIHELEIKYNIPSDIHLKL